MTAGGSRGDRQHPWQQRICFGGDYNPEQWDPQVWVEDITLMNEAGVDLVAINVFGWADLEPREGDFNFDRLDQVLDLLHQGGVDVNLGTGTSSPPPWLSKAYPETMPTLADGTRLWPGGRQAIATSSQLFRTKALTLVRALAEHVSDHPAVVLWHVSNEIGCHTPYDYSDESAAAFRAWLASRYSDIHGLNQAWGTAFWSQRYDSFDEVLPPRQAPTFANPTQQLDFKRFTSDALLDYYCAERDVLREITPDIPVTTNFMITNHIQAMDYHRWATEMDIVANDHYLDTSLVEPWRELSFCADLTRGTAAGAPWMLMEHSTSAVNWQPRNVAKRPGEMARNSLAHVARGADTVCFFQWRASKAGAEKFHSALVPHAGTDSRVWREGVDLGAALDRLDVVAGSTVQADVALVFDWNAWWGVQLDSHPSVEVTYLDQAHAIHAALTDLGITADNMHPSADLSGYRLVVVPTLYLVDDVTVANLTRFVDSGGHVLITFFSGITDESDHIRLGGYPGAFRDLLGVRSEEFLPMRAGETAHVSSAELPTLESASATVWSEALRLDGATSVANWRDGPAAGAPAITRNTFGDGTAWYLSTRLDQAATQALVEFVAQTAAVTGERGAGAGIEIVRRVGNSGEFVFVINHRDEPVRVPIEGVDLLTGQAHNGETDIGPGAVAVIEVPAVATPVLGRVQVPGQGGVA